MIIKNKAVFDSEDLANAITIAESIKTQVEVLLAHLQQDELNIAFLDCWRTDMRDVSDEAGMLAHCLDNMTQPYNDQIYLQMLLEHRANLIAEGVDTTAMPALNNDIARLEVAE